MALSEVDRNLLERCVNGRPRAWEDFVDRFMGLIIHVVNHTAQAKSIRLSDEDREDLCGDVFMRIVRDDFTVLRSFRGQCSLATYLTVVARRVVVRQLLKRRQASALGDWAGSSSDGSGVVAEAADERSDPLFENREEVERLLAQLGDSDAQIVRMFHLEGKSYREISAAIDIPENSLGPRLSRARERLRELLAEVDSPSH